MPETLFRNGAALRRLWPIVFLMVASLLAVSNVNPVSSVSTTQTTTTAPTMTGDRLTVMTDKFSYIPSQTVNIWGHAVVPDVTMTYACAGYSPCGLSVRIDIYSSGGSLVHEAFTDPYLAGYGSFFYAWQIPCNFGLGTGGNFTVKAATELANLELKGQTIIFISSPMGTTTEALSVTTDKPRYAPGAMVHIKGLLQSGELSIIGAGTAFADIALNITQPLYPPYRVIFQTRLNNLTAGVFSSANCPMVNYPRGEDYPLPSVYFALRFLLPSNASGAYMVRAAVTGFRNNWGQSGGSGGEGEAIFTVGQWNDTVTALGMTTTQTFIPFETVTGSSLVTSTAAVTLVLTSTFTATVSEFDGAALVVLMTFVLVATLFKMSSRRRSDKGSK